MKQAAAGHVSTRSINPERRRGHLLPGERVSVCGLIIADRSHRKVTGDQFKFCTICDYTVIECEIFA